MIDPFPCLQPLTSDLGAAVGSYTRRFPVYSDFSHTSMLAWDLTSNLRVGDLYGNLVVADIVAAKADQSYDYAGKCEQVDLSQFCRSPMHAVCEARALYCLIEDDQKNLTCVQPNVEFDIESQLAQD